MKLTNKGFTPLDKFIENCEHILGEVEKYQIKNIVSDNLVMKALTKEHQEFIADKWIAGVIQHGVTKIASVVPEDVFGQMGLTKRLKLSR